MRRRLVAAFVGLAAVVIVAFGVPRGFVVAHLVESNRQELLEQSADLAEHVAADAVERGAPVTAGMLAETVDDGERLEYRAPGQPTIVVPAGEAEPSGDDLTTRRPVGDDAELTITYPRNEVRAEVLDALWPLLLLALLIVVLSALAGWLLARRLARPFTELAGAAEQLGRGHLDVDVPHYPIPEADAIARALEEGSQRLQRMVRREREVSDAASHDLRTPITALRLTLEDLSLWPETPPVVADELARIVAEVDRFSAAVTTLVEPPAATGSASLVDVTGLVRQAVHDRDGRREPGQVRFRLATESPVLARLQSVPARQVVDLLLEHVADGPAAEAVVRVLGGTGHLSVDVECPGDRPDADRGVVWDQAVGRAAELGGRLVVGSGSPGATVWTLTLPKGLALRDG